MKAIIFELVVFSFSQYAISCSCDRDYDPQKSHEVADVIFIGEVVSKDWFFSFTKNRFKYQNLIFYKGNEHPEIKIITQKSSTACGLSYEKGKQYIIYAYKSKQNNEQLRTSKCSSWPITDEHQKRTAKFLEFYKNKSIENTKEE